VKKSRHKRYKSDSGGRYAALAILGVILLAIGGYLLFGSGSQLFRQPPAPPASQRAPLPARAPEVPQEGQQAPAEAVPGTGDSAYPTETVPPVESGPHGEKGAGKGLLAIIIDDMGSSMHEARSLAGIGVPLTFSIIPGLASYREVASFAASSGIETMIHLPMQPKGWPQHRLEANGLLLSMDDTAIADRLEGFMRDIPRATGANNHMGSEFTENEEKMRVVMGALKARGLFFIDSVTSPHTKGLRLAREMGVKSERRNVFLDNEQNSAYIQGQLNQAVRLARKTGAGIAICHPHPATIKTLAALLPGLEKQGITLVPVSRLVR